MKTQRLFAALAVPAALCAVPPAAAQPLQVAEIAPGVFVHQGRHEESSAENRGDIANVGFIVGSRCVAVIDTGGSIAVGRALREAVAGRSALPICYVVNTHVHPDHIFGNAAFVADRPAFVGHAKLRAAMAARGRSYLNALRRDLGSPAEGTQLIAPTLPVKERLELDLGDRVLELRAWSTAHTDNDLSVFDRATRTLWVGDLLFVRRVPVVDGSVKGWLAVLAQLPQLDALRWVPGHGAIVAPKDDALRDEERYLATLLRETRGAIKGKRTISQAVDEVGVSERANWLLFWNFHRRNVTAVYAELEWE